MKLARYGQPGHERPGLIDSNGNLRDLSAHIQDVHPRMLDATGLEFLRGVDPEELPIVDGKPRLGACVNGVEKFIGIGLNYKDHAAEVGKPTPAEPIIFMKATSSISGPNDPIEMPAGSGSTDWEVELGVIIGSMAKNVLEADALEHVAGYCTVNDVSERHWQSAGTGQWVKGKSYDSFGPIGPWLVTRDEITDPQCLDLCLHLNGELRQSGNTAEMVFGVAHLVSYVSRFMTLRAGDIIATGTPPGVGMGYKPRRFLKVGDTLSLEVSGLGSQHHTLIGG
jgi:2-keto-4-pentenoate hydratase/2-oxohepta-3-ene-1,7-dioic acid hydratase in catechol pathway